MATNMKVCISDFTTSFLVGVVNCSSWAVMSSFEAVIHQTTARFLGFVTLQKILQKRLKMSQKSPLIIPEKLSARTQTRVTAIEKLQLSFMLIQSLSTAECVDYKLPVTRGNRYQKVNFSSLLTASFANDLMVIDCVKCTNLKTLLFLTAF